MGSGSKVECSDLLAGSSVEKFFVFRRINHDETWGAITLDCGDLYRVPNIDFGMKVYAKNEKAAIARGKAEYDKIHAYDNEKESVRRFASSALRAIIVGSAGNTDDLDDITEQTMKIAVMLTNKYNEHFKERDDQAKVSVIDAGNSGEWEVNQSG